MNIITDLSDLQTKPMKKLLELRDTFEQAIVKYPTESFIRYLGMIQVEIASRIGKK